MMIGVSAVLAANALMGTVVGLRLAAADHAAALIGAVVAGFAVGLTIGAVRAARVIERVGHIRAFTVFCAGACLSVLAMLPSDAPWAWAALRVLGGYCVAGIYLVVESWLSAAADPADRGRVLAGYIATCQVALGAGQLMVGQVPLGGAAPFALAAALYAAALIPVGLTRTPQPLLPEAPAISALAAVRQVPLAALACGVSGAVVGTVLSLAPAELAATGASTALTARYMAVVMFGGLLLLWPAGWASARVGRRQLLELLACGAAGTALVGHAAHGAGGVLLLAQGAAIGAFAFALYPVSLAYAHDRASPDQVVATNGAMVLAYSIGASAAPVLGGALVDGLGPVGLHLWLAALPSLVVGAAVIRGIRRRLSGRGVVGPGEAPFAPVALPRVAPAGELDPRVPRDGPPRAS